MKKFMLMLLGLGLQSQIEATTPDVFSWLSSLPGQSSDGNLVNFYTLAQEASNGLLTNVVDLAVRNFDLRAGDSTGFKAKNLNFPTIGANEVVNCKVKHQGRTEDARARNWAGRIMVDMPFDVARGTDPLKFECPTTLEPTLNPLKFDDLEFLPNPADISQNIVSKFINLAPGAVRPPNTSGNKVAASGPFASSRRIVTHSTNKVNVAGTLSLIASGYTRPFEAGDYVTAFFPKSYNIGASAVCTVNNTPGTTTFEALKDAAGEVYGTGVKYIIPTSLVDAPPSNLFELHCTKVTQTSATPSTASVPTFALYSAGDVYVGTFGVPETLPSFDGSAPSTGSLQTIASAKISHTGTQAYSIGTLKIEADLTGITIPALGWISVEIPMEDAFQPLPSVGGQGGTICTTSFNSQFQNVVLGLGVSSTAGKTTLRFTPTVSGPDFLLKIFAKPTLSITCSAVRNTRYVPTAAPAPDAKLVLSNFLMFPLAEMAATEMAGIPTAPNTLAVPFSAPIATELRPGEGANVIFPFVGLPLGILHRGDKVTVAISSYTATADTVCTMNSMLGSAESYIAGFTGGISDIVTGQTSIMDTIKGSLNDIFNFRLADIANIFNLSTQGTATPLGASGFTVEMEVKSRSTIMVAGFYLECNNLVNPVGITLPLFNGAVNVTNKDGDEVLVSVVQFYDVFSIIGKKIAEIYVDILDTVKDAITKVIISIIPKPSIPPPTGPNVISPPSSENALGSFFGIRKGDGLFWDYDGLNFDSADCTVAGSTVDITKSNGRVGFLFDSLLDGTMIEVPAIVCGGVRVGNLGGASGFLDNVFSYKPFTSSIMDPIFGVQTPDVAPGIYNEGAYGFGIDILDGGFKYNITNLINPGKINAGNGLAISVPTVFLPTDNSTCDLEIAGDGGVEYITLTKFIKTTTEHGLDLNEYAALYENDFDIAGGAGLKINCLGFDYNPRADLSFQEFTKPVVSTLAKVGGKFYTIFRTFIVGIYDGIGDLIPPPIGTGSAGSGSAGSGSGSAGSGSGSAGSGSGSAGSGSGSAGSGTTPGPIDGSDTDPGNSNTTDDDDTPTGSGGSGNGTDNGGSDGEPTTTDTTATTNSAMGVQAVSVFVATAAVVSAIAYLSRKEHQD